MPIGIVKESFRRRCRKSLHRMHVFLKTDAARRDIRAAYFRA